MTFASSWIVRAGGGLLAASFFIPQHAAGGRSYSPLTFLAPLSGTLDAVELAVFGAWLAAPAGIGVSLLASSFLRNEGGAFLRGVFVAALLGGAFCLATLGSLQLTSPQPYNGTIVPSAPLSLALFVLPLIAAALALARILGGADPRKTGSFARVAVALFVALNGLFLADFGWAVLDVWIGSAGTGRTLPGAWTAPAGALLAVAGEIQARVRSVPPPLAVPHPSG